MKKILVRTPQWLGDAVVSTVFLTRLKSHFPDASISVLCSPALAPLFEAHPVVTSAIPWSYPTGSVFDLAKRLKNEQFDIAYILPRSFRAAFESFLAKIPRRVGYSGDLRRFLLTDVFAYDDRLSYAHRYLKLIGDEEFPLNQTAPLFPVSALPSEFADLPAPILGIAPVSIAPARTWDPNRFAQVADQFLSERGGSVVLFGSAREREAVQKIADQIQGRVVNTAGKLSLPQLGAMIKRCTVFLANDSGLMHVAACFKTPTVVLFGASDPTYALPPWGQFLALQHKEIFCVPCLKNECVRFGEERRQCMTLITVLEVWAALKEVMDQNKKNAS